MDSDQPPLPLSKKLILFVVLIILWLIAQPVVAAQQDNAWQTLPVIPELSEFSKKLLQEGIAAGNNPHAFSKVGDCETSTDWYLHDFDLDDRYYNLGEYKEEFEPVLAFYKGSFLRRSLAAKPGFSAASVLSSYWIDYSNCAAGELPLTCEYNQHNPLVVLISMGTNDGYNPPVFKENLRAIITATLEQKRLPVLMTKADNVEGTYAINRDIAALAAEYEIPLWNYWAAIQSLPNGGLVEDGIHLTFYKNDFSDPYAWNYAWTYRNFTALQMLETLMNATKPWLP
ncbi:MAG: hypothetical protein GX933_04320 [Chloroflexi bacterium]|nr:hypothetical protein [Chloroflexota bacterium]